MTVLDSGGVLALAHDRERVRQLVRRNAWPPVVPSVVLVEALTGDHRRDFDVNRLLTHCLIEDVTDSVARLAARLRTRTRRAGDISAVDAVVAATVVAGGHAAVITSDPRDITDLLNDSDRVAIMRV